MEEAIADLERKLAVLIEEHDEIRSKLSALDDRFAVNRQQITSVQRRLDVARVPTQESETDG